MKCIIIDDEPLAREGMELNVREVAYLEHCGSFSNALAANDYLSKHHIDLMFLDIQMPGITGLEFIKSLKHKPQIILTTAYPEHALEGFELQVTDYLLKPIRLSRFVKAVNKAKERYDLHREGGSEENPFIYIKSDRKYIKVYYEDICYISGLKDYVSIHCQDKKRITTAMNVKTILSQLPNHIFTRVSKSHVINVNFIEEVETDLIRMQGMELPLGKSYKEDFLQSFIKNKTIKR